MSEQVHICISTILKDAKGTPLRTEEIHQKLETEYSFKGDRRTTERALTYLNKLGVASRVLHRKINARAITAWVHTEYKVLADIQLKLRSEHTHSIQDEIIKPLLGQLPEISKDGAYQRNGSVLIPTFKDKHEKLPIENNILFPDFEYHINLLQPKWSVLIDNFKEKVEGFWRKKVDLYDDLKALVEIETKLSMISSKKSWEDDKYYPELINWIYGVFWAFVEGKNKNVKRTYYPLSSEIQDTGSSFRYFIDGKGCIQFKKRKKNEQEVKKELDNNIRNIIKIIIKSGTTDEKGKNILYKEGRKSTYYSKTHLLVQTVNEIKSLERTIRLTLGKGLHRELLPGYCKQIKDLLKDEEMLYKEK